MTGEDLLLTYGPLGPNRTDDDDDEIYPAHLIS